MYCTGGEPVDAVYEAGAQLPNFSRFVDIAGDVSILRIAALLCEMRRRVNDRVRDVHRTAELVYRGQTTVYGFIGVLKSIALGVARAIYSAAAGQYRGETVVTVTIDVEPPTIFAPSASVEAVVTADGERLMAVSPVEEEGIEMLGSYLENHYPLLDVLIKALVTLCENGRCKTLAIEYSVTRVPSITIVDEVTGETARIEDCEQAKIVCIGDACYLGFDPMSV